MKAANHQPPTPFLHRHGRELLICLGLFLTVFVVFGRALQADFVQWDDDSNIYRNPHLGPPTIERIVWMFTDAQYFWRYQPFGWLTWSVIHLFFGLNPFGYHLGNLLLHGLNAGLVFLLIRKLLLLTAGSPTAPASNALLAGAGLGAAIWAVHPLRVENVAWAVELPWCQAMLFLLVSLLCYLKAAHRDKSNGRWPGIYWLAVFCFAASLFSFPVALGLLPALVALDFYPLRKIQFSDGQWWNPAARRAVWQKMPFLFFTLLAFSISIYSRTHTVDTWSRPVSLDEFGWLPRLMQAFYLWTYYLWKSLLPVGLSPVYTQLVQFDPISLPFVASTAGIIGITAALVYFRQHWPGGLALWIAHLALLVPMLGLTEHPHYPGDRYNLAASVGWAVLLAAGLWRLWVWPRFRAIGLAGAGALALLFGTMSFQQTRVWENSVTLFEYTIRRLGKDPYRADLQYRLGKYHLDQGNFSGGVARLQQASSLRPDSPLVRYHLACGLMNLGQWSEALPHATAVLQLAPQMENTHNLIGIILAQQGKLREAADQFSAELSARPNHAGALMNRSLALARLGQVEPALADFSRALQFAPDDFGSHRQAIFFQALARASAQSDRWPEAVKLAQRALELARSAKQTELAYQVEKELQSYLSRRVPPL